MKIFIFQHKGIKFSFNESYMFFLLKWDDYKLYITVMQISILSWWEVFILQMDMAILSVCIWFAMNPGFSPNDALKWCVVMCFSSENILM